jgi:exonuclease III
MLLKIGSLNLCLGLPNKKICVKNIIIDEQIDVLCLQETELGKNLNHNLMSFPGCALESELNEIRSRVGCLVKSNISYVRRVELEGLNSHLIILDIKAKSNKRIINIYRPFNPPNGLSPLEFFKYQIDLISIAYNNETILVGDINLD